MDLANDISREQEHLMLMQDQVDKQKNMLQKELSDLGKKLEQERTQRSSAMSSLTETMDMLRTTLNQREADIEDLEARMVALERRASVWGNLESIFGCCCGRTSNRSHPAAELMEPLSSRDRQDNIDTM